jgi:hypothetical protein
MNTAVRSRDSYARTGGIKPDSMAVFEQRTRLFAIPTHLAEMPVIVCSMPLIWRTWEPGVAPATDWASPFSFARFAIRVRSLRKTTSGI